MDGQFRFRQILQLGRFRISDFGFRIARDGRGLVSGKIAEKGRLFVDSAGVAGSGPGEAVANDERLFLVRDKTCWNNERKISERVFNDPLKTRKTLKKYSVFRVFSGSIKIWNAIGIAAYSCRFAIN
ncbi:MAG: hypothetical protein JSS81_00835 [Acidobacteria bacterium]|nr:hypothetical protein [Acidobacteriota bacterium]